MTSMGDKGGTPPALPAGMDAAYYALSLLRRHRLEACVALSAHHLRLFTERVADTPSHLGCVDAQLWFIQTKALVQQNWFDELDVDDDGVDAVLLDGEQSVRSSAPRPGTSLRPPSARPASGRHGYARPGSAARVGTAVRPLTGRLLRVGTASLQSVPGGPHVDVARLDLPRYARERPLVAPLLGDYLLHVEHRPRLAVDLALAALSGGGGRWWCSRLGQAYYRLGLLREAERQWEAALDMWHNAADAMRLAKVFLKLDQPLTALEVLTEAVGRHPLDHQLLLGMARIHEQLQDTQSACQNYRRVLQLDSSNVEAIACIAAHFFYDNQQPELALRLYRRLLQMGVQTTELWNNLGLCCFYSSQYDIALSCLQRAIAVASEDELLADVWYNIGHVGICTGDLGLAHRAFKVAVSANPHHAEALNNLAVLKLRAGQTDQARSDLAMALAVNEEQHEALYNAALIAFREGNFEEAYKYVSQALNACPDHPESVSLQTTLRNALISV